MCRYYTSLAGRYQRQPELAPPRHMLLMALITKKGAREMGRTAGLAAASWKFDGNTPLETYWAFLRGFLEGDPRTMDAYAPPGWLSGEWAGESITEILGSPETQREEDRMAGVMEAYETAADDAYWAELERAARYQLRDTEYDMNKRRA